MLASWYAYVAASDPDRTPYDLSIWCAGASVVGTAMSTWLAYRLSPAGLPAAVLLGSAFAFLELLYPDNAPMVEELLMNLYRNSALEEFLQAE